MFLAPRICSHEPNYTKNVWKSCRRWFLAPKNDPDHYKTQEMCEKAVEKDPWRLYDVPDHFKTAEMFKKAVQSNPSCLEYVPEAVVEKLFF